MKRKPKVLVARKRFIKFDILTDQIRIVEAFE